MSQYIDLFNETVFDGSTVTVETLEANNITVLNTFDASGVTGFFDETTVGYNGNSTVRVLSIPSGIPITTNSFKIYDADESNTLHLKVANLITDRILTFPAPSSDFHTVLTDQDPIDVSQKGFQDATVYIYNSGDTSKKLYFDVSQITTGTSRTITVLDETGTMVLANSSQLILNKTFEDSSFKIRSSFNTSNYIQFDATVLSAPRLYAWPDESGGVCLVQATQTLTNKTLTAPIIATIVNTGTLTLPTSTDTLVGRATTDTLVNKTLTSPIISTILNGAATLTLPSSTDTLVARDTTDTLTNKTITSSTNAVRASTIGNSGDANNVTITNSPTSGNILVATSSTGASWQGASYPLTGFTDAANTALGVNAMDSITTGQFNCAFGKSALTTATTANHYTAVGYQALNTANATTGPCSAYGSNSQYTLTSGIKNNSFGYYSMYSSTTGSDNIAIGNESLYQNTTSSNNIAIGTEALYNLTTTGNNIGIGYRAGKANTSGQYNNYIGYSSGVAVTTGSYNHFIGYNSGVACTTGSRNFGIGYNALGSVTTTDQNIAMGDNAVYGCTTGTKNIGIGTNAMYNITTGTDNTAVGDQAGYGINSGLNAGNDNVFIGSQARPFSTCNQASVCGSTSGQSIGASNICILGYSAGPTSSTHNNSIYVGSFAGNAGSGSSRFYTITSLSTLSGTALQYISSTGQIGPTSSNSIFKKDIVNYAGNSENIFNVQPKKFRYKDDDSNGPLTIGYLAEELDAILPECVVYDKAKVGEEPNGKAILGDSIPYSIRYDLLVVPIIEEMKKMQSKIQQLETEINYIKNNAVIL